MLQCTSMPLTARRRGAIVPHRAADRSWAQWAKAMTRQDGATLWTAHHVARLMGQGMPCASYSIITMFQHLMP
jgi:hypothetical protein